MMKPPVFVVAAAAVSLVVAAGYLWMQKADACGDRTPAADVEPHTCSLDPAARDGAIAELAAFSARHLHDVEATVTASFRGDHAQLEPFLTAAIEREASCCSFLSFELVRTEQGYNVVMATSRGGLGELTAALEAMSPR